MLTSTIPLTLTGRLPGGGEVDANAGLVYLGDGRYYDPALGVFLQPDPFGGAPEAPASLNRYAAAGLSTLPTLDTVPGGGSNTVEVAISLGTNLFKLAVDEGAVSPRFGSLGSRFRSWLHGLSQAEHWTRMPYWESAARSARLARVLDAGDELLGRFRFGRSWVRNMVGGTLVGWGRAAHSTLNALNTRSVLRYRWVREIVENEAWWGRTAGRMAQSRAWGFAGRHLGGFFAGAAVDVGFQFLWDLAFEPDLTWQERGLRVAAELPGTAASYVVGGLAGWVTSGIVTYFSNAALGAVIGGPIGLLVGFGVAVYYDIVWKPKVYRQLGLD